MKNFTFIEKNGNGVLYLTAENEDEACEIHEELVKDPDAWRLDDVHDDVDL